MFLSSYTVHVLVHMGKKGFVKRSCFLIARSMVVNRNNHQISLFNPVISCNSSMPKNWESCMTIVRFFLKIL